MRYELKHDMLAQQVYEKAGAESKARRRVEARLGLALSRYQDRGVLLSKEDLDEWRLFQDNLDIGGPVMDLIQKSAQNIKAKEQAERKRLYLFLILISGVALIAAFLAFNASKQKKRFIQAQYEKIQQEAASFETEERFADAINKYLELKTYNQASEDSIAQKLSLLSDKKRKYETYYQLVTEADSLFEKALERQTADSEKHYCQALGDYISAAELLPEKNPLLQGKINLTIRFKNTAISRLEKDMEVFAQLPDNRIWWEECQKAWQVLKNCRYK